MYRVFSFLGVKSNTQNIPTGEVEEFFKQFVKQKHFYLMHNFEDFHKQFVEQKEFYLMYNFEEFHKQFV